MPRPEQLVERIKNADRRALAQAITLVESTRPADRHDALTILDHLLEDTGDAIRVGISGAPGVGKSTFIEALGIHLVDADHRVAVLTVDPSSQRTGGSILGDKTRMGRLARHPNVFIRPSPSGGTLGGVAARSREAMLLCEAFGFDVTLVETVGVGQSEAAVDNLVDVFVLLVQPGAGDELQAMKRGVVELADLVVVTKADGELQNAARRAAADYRHALRLLRPKRPGWDPPVIATSAIAAEGVDTVWEHILRHQELLRGSGGLETRRADQAKAWFWSEVTEQVVARFQRRPEVSSRLPSLQDAVAKGVVSPSRAAWELLEGEWLEGDGAGD